MASALRIIACIVLVCTALHFLLSDTSFLDDYRIWRPALHATRQEIILVHDFNDNTAPATTGGTKPGNKPVATVTQIHHPSSQRQPLHAASNVATDLAAPPSTLTNNDSSGSTTTTTNITTQGTVVTTQLLLDSINVSLRMQPQNSSLEKCPTTPPGLVGPIKVWFDEPEFSEIEALYPHLEPGGHGKPKNCQAQHRVAIVVPYRDREVHLRIFLHNLHSLLSKQQLDYAIFIVEQHANETFNRAKLMNVGFAEAMKLYDWQCFIFHDVDLLPENDRNIYSCPEQPRHMSVAIDKFKYKLPYGSIFGGISAMTVEQFVKINGFSNDYWGWGGEDDDLSTRVTYAGYHIMRYPSEIARYKMIKHLAEKKNPLNKCRYALMAKTQKRQQIDGLTSLKYRRYDLQLRPLFTHIKVELLEEESKENLRKQGFKKC